MGKKRGAKKSAPPPPPPPPPASSEETHSGADASESEDEETIPVSRAPAPKNPPPPPQKDEESETSEEEEDEEEEEEEASHAAPTSAPKNQMPAARQSEDSDGSEEEEEEDGGSESGKDAPPPKQEAMTPEAKKPRRIWSTDDKVRILEALAAHKKEHGVLPEPDDLVEALAGKLDNRAYSSKELQGKLKALKHVYLTAAKKHEPPSKEHYRQLFDLSKLVWGKSTARPDPAATDAAAAKGDSHEAKGFEEMCELYPYLAEEVKKMEPRAMFKREFGKIDDDRARMLNEKIKKQMVEHIKMELRRTDLIREVTKTMMDLID